MKRFSTAVTAIFVAPALLVWQILFLADSGPFQRRTPLVGERPSDSVDGWVHADQSPIKESDPAPEAANESEAVPHEAEHSEATFLERLDQLNVVDKEAALELARHGEDLFGDSGEGAEARRAMKITLLVDLGRMSVARDEVQRFIERHPQSRYRGLVQGVTGMHPRPGPPAHVLD